MQTPILSVTKQNVLLDDADVSEGEQSQTSKSEIKTTTKFKLKRIYERKVKMITTNRRPFRRLKNMKNVQILSASHYTLFESLYFNK